MMPNCRPRRPCPLRSSLVLITRTATARVVVTKDNALSTRPAGFGTGSLELPTAAVVKGDASDSVIFYVKFDTLYEKLEIKTSKRIVTI